MPHPKRQPLTNRKHTIERQIVLARRSKSIKAPLLKVLSLDLVSLYQADQARNSERSHYSLNLHDPTEPCNANRFISRKLPPPDRPTQQSVTRSAEAELNQAQNTSVLDDSKVISRPTNQKLFATVIARCFAFLLGVLIRYALISYVQPFAVLLSGVAFSAKRNCVATAVSVICVLVVVMFTPWEKKLL